MIQDEKFPKSLFDNSLWVAKKIGFPLFMRTDHTSFKHGWKKTCYVPDEESLERHIVELLTYSMMQGWISYTDTGLFFREFLELTTRFTAFHGEFPVNKERRYFIRNGKVQCFHPYWYPDAIESPSIKNWRERVSEINKFSPSEATILLEYAKMVADVHEFHDGYWSVDFAEGTDGTWYLIDMALGDESFHWLECQCCSDEMRKKYENR